MECAELLAVDSAYDKATPVLARLLGVNVSVLARETTVAEHSQAVLSFYAQRAAFSRREEGPILIAHADGKGVRLVRDEAPPTGRRRKGDKKTHKKEAIAGAATSHAAKALRRVAGYLQRNLPYMDDARYWKLGWPIGTGVIEGACRHLVKDRRELSGMRWTVPGAEALLALRAVQRNDDWDTFQQFRRQQRHNNSMASHSPRHGSIPLSDWRSTRFSHTPII
jgi:hypothetical protein